MTEFHTERMQKNAFYSPGVSAANSGIFRRLKGSMVIKDETYFYRSGS